MTTQAAIKDYKKQHDAHMVTWAKESPCYSCADAAVKEGWLRYRKQAERYRKWKEQEEFNTRFLGAGWRERLEQQWRIQEMKARGGKKRRM